MATELNLELDQALNSDHWSPSAFRIERLSTAGVPIGPGVYLWEKTLAISGTGSVDLTSRRSIADINGEEIGVFHDTIDESTIRRLAEIILESRLADLPPF